MNLKKTLVAAAVAAAAAAPAASFAAATMYGSVEFGLQQQGKTQSNYKSSTSFFDNGSRIGFKGNNDLGNGLTGFYNMQLGVDLLNGNSAGNASSPYSESGGQLYTRLGYFGVKGSFGSVAVGRMNGLYYSFINEPTDTPNVLAGPLNPIGFINSLGSTSTAAPTMADVYKAGPLGGYASRVNAATYVTPNFSGFTGGVSYLDIGTYNQYSSTSQQYGKQQGVYQLGGKYTIGPGYVAAAYMGIPKDNVNFGFMQDVWGLSGGYSFGAFGVDANYQQAKPRTNGPEALTGNNNNKSMRSFAVQGSYSMGPLYAYVQYSQLKWKYLSNKTADRTTAGVFYNIAKPLQVTFEVANSNKYASSALLSETNFSAQSVAAGNGTANPKSYTTFAIGANYNF